MYARIARVCPKDDCGYRRFFASERVADQWRCPDHHQAVVQANRPYRGKKALRDEAERALGLK